MHEHEVLETSNLKNKSVTRLYKILPLTLIVMNPLPIPASLLASNMYSPSSLSMIPIICKDNLSDDKKSRGSLLNVMSTLLPRE